MFLFTDCLQVYWDKPLALHGITWLRTASAAACSVKRLSLGGSVTTATSGEPPAAQHAYIF